MPRYEQYGRLDSPPVQDGESGLVGVNMLDDPSTLPPGLAADATNARFTQNEAAARGGFIKLPWTNRIVAGDAPPQPFGGEVLAAEVFRDPNGLEWTIIAAGGRVYKTRENNGASEIPLPPGIVLAAPISFTQTFSGFVMFRGADLDELILLTIDDGFVPVAQVDNLINGAGTENPTDGTRVIPPANNGEWINNRLFIPTGDYLEVSDYLNPTRYASVRAQARINEGSSDELVRFFKFNTDTGIAFKSESIYILSGLTGALEDMSSDELTREYGLCAARSCVNVGTDVWFMSEKRGVCSVTLTTQGEIQGVDVPISRALQPLIDRIDWRNAANICAKWHDNKVYFAVPLDDSISLAVTTPGDFVSDHGLMTAHGILVIGAKYRVRLDPSETLYFSGVSIFDPMTESDDIIVAGNPRFTIDRISGTHTTPRTTIQRIYENVNNAVLVYDTLKGQWAGRDVGTGLMVQSWFTPQYDGRRRLAFVSSDGFINLYEEGVYDEVAKETAADILPPVPSSPVFTAGSCTFTVVAGRQYVWMQGFGVLSLINGTETLLASGNFTAQGNTITFIQDPGPMVGIVTGGLGELYATIIPTWVQLDVTSRAMSGAPPGDQSPESCAVRNQRKRWQGAELNLRTWFPQFTFTALTEGVSEEETIAQDQTTDRTKYYRPAFAPPYDVTNVNDDHAVKFREDYSVVLSEDVTPSGSIATGVVYYVESLDGAASVVYNGVTYNAPALFTGVAGVTTYTVGSGTPSVYGPGAYVFLGDTGINFDRLQDATIPLHLANSDVRGRGVQLRLQVTQGLVRWSGCDVNGVMEGKIISIQG